MCRTSARTSATSALVIAALASSFLAASCRRAPDVDPTYRAEVERWRRERVADLGRDNGWLTLVGLFWLKPGENRFGSAPDAPLRLEGKGVPPIAGSLFLAANGDVRLIPAPTAGVTLNGQPATEAVLRADRDGEPDIVSIGTLRMHVIVRGEARGVRVRDPQSQARLAFNGIDCFPIDPAYRVEATLERIPQPREVLVASAHGPEQRMLVPGTVRFALKGRTLSLVPFVTSPDDDTLFFVFRDATSGQESYGAGRFLDAKAPAKGSTTFVLDFNYSTNPPCAFTPYATCPLPPKENVLPVRIEAGEETPHIH